MSKITIVQNYKTKKARIAYLKKNGKKVGREFHLKEGIGLITFLEDTDN